MAVIDEETKQQAKELWLQGKKYREISEITGIKESSIKSLASRAWKKEKLQPNKKKVATLVADADKDKGPPETELLPEEIETLNNEELTEKQRLFCLYYSKSFNATSAYKKAYDCSYQTAMCEGSKTLGNPKIKDEIMRLKKERYARSMLTKEDIFQKYMDIAFADITDFLEFGSDQIDADSGDVVSKNFVHFRHHTTVDGTLIGEVKQGKDGTSIKLPDRMKALQWLSDHMGWATDLQKAQIEQLRAQTDKLKADSNDIPDESVQNKMDAITGIVDQMQPLGDDDV
ncbi:terminase small subunit [[Clostridium] innocuum]|uniref:terminase small subunit n=1 Tax=Clostridium innocuum TaxID=1522 RepID=UPI003DA31920